MKSLESCVENLDPESITHFLSQLSQSKETEYSHEECTVDIYEELARDQGPNIVPYLEAILLNIIRALSSKNVSFSLHQACSKAISAIARYCIDPSTPELEKTRIIRSIATPLSDILMSPHGSSSSGAALCMEALVESDNWQFAPDDTVYEVCLKVAGALEEKATQTNPHMSLAVSLSKHNASIVESYARPLVRSGLRILNAGFKESYSDKRLQAIQMIDSLMTCVDSRSFSSEIFKVVDTMKKCENDDMRSVRVAASDAIEKAKVISGLKAAGHEICSNLNNGSRFGSNFGKFSWISRDHVDAREPDPSDEFLFQESQTLDSIVDQDTLGDCKLDSVRRANRRSWCDGNCGSNTGSVEDCFHNSGLNGDNSEIYCGQMRNGDLCETERHNGSSDASSGDNDGVVEATSPVLQRSNPDLIVDEDAGSQISNFELKVRRVDTRIRKLAGQTGTQERAIDENRSALPIDRTVCGDRTSGSHTLKTKRRRIGRAALGIVCCILAVVVYAIATQIDNTDDLVPT